MKKSVLLMLPVFVAHFCFTQNRSQLDSLKYQISIEKKDTSRVNTLRDLCTEYWGVNPDSSLKYGQQSLALSQKIHYPLGEARAFNTLGVLYRRLGDYPKSLETNFKGLQIAEKKQLTLPTIGCLNAIALVYKELKNYSKGINYYKRGLKIATATQHQYWMTQIELNLATTYLETHQIDSASLYLQKVSSKLDLVKGKLIIKFYPLKLGKLQFLKGDYANAYLETHFQGDLPPIEIIPQDNGNGIPESIKDKIFQPFFTTKPTGQGTGLGLSLAYDIVTKGHGGTLDVRTQENEGTEFVIRLG
jgi:tetratricopeptide (TPR) repeat protein